VELEKLLRKQNKIVDDYRALAEMLKDIPAGLLLLIVKHLAVDKTEPVEEMLHLILARTHQSKDGLGAVVFSRSDKLFHHFLRHPPPPVDRGRRR
jgi:hypothetical protein